MMSFVRRMSIGLALVGALGAARSADAQANPARTDAAAPGASRIAFINAGALLRGMPGYAQAESTFAKEAEVAQNEAQKVRAAFDSLVADYQRSQAMMNPTQRTNKERSLTAKGDTVQAQLQQIQTRIANRERELLSPMQERLKAIIEGVRAEGNFAMVIDLSSEVSANIVSYDKSLDITMRVAQRLTQSEN